MFKKFPFFLRQEQVIHLIILLTLESDMRLVLGLFSSMCMLCQQQSLARLGCGLYALSAASRPAAVSMGGCVPRSLHHLERARHVCNGLSHASLQTVFSLQKLHKELCGGGLTNALSQFPTGPVAFSQIEA